MQKLLNLGVIILCAVGYGAATIC